MPNVRGSFRRLVWVDPTVATDDRDWNNYCGYKVYMPNETDYCGGNQNGGSGGEYYGPPSMGGELGWLCEYKDLEPGCYDVFVDGEYADTICC